MSLHTTWCTFDRSGAARPLQPWSVLGGEASPGDGAIHRENRDPSPFFFLLFLWLLLRVFWCWGIVCLLVWFVETVWFQGQSHSIIRQFHLVPCHFPRPVPFHHPAVSLGALPFPKTCPIPSTIAVISCKLPLLLQGNVDVLCCFCRCSRCFFWTRGPEKGAFPKHLLVPALKNTHFPKCLFHSLVTVLKKGHHSKLASR